MFFQNFIKESAAAAKRASEMESRNESTSNNVHATGSPSREKRRKAVEEDDDIPSETLAEVIQNITDPKLMTGPDVSFFTLLFNI